MWCASFPSTCVIFLLCWQVVVDVMEAGKLVLYPQILLACTALLGMSYVHLWSLLLRLLSKVCCVATSPSERKHSRLRS